MDLHFWRAKVHKKLWRKSPGADKHGPTLGPVSLHGLWLKFGDVVTERTKEGSKITYSYTVIIYGVCIYSYYYTLLPAEQVPGQVDLKGPPVPLPSAV